ncbi:MAG: ComEA family DNA-binding protein [Bryobacteraceae bacterium]
MFVPHTCFGSTVRDLLLSFAVLAFPSATAFAQNLPDAPGKAETVKVCSGCHEVTRVTSVHLDRAGWQTEMEKMISLGAKGSPEEFESILNYLSKSFPAEEIPKVRINSARQIELEAGLTLRRSQAAALVAYRSKHGPFKSIEDLKNVPGLDFAYIESKKDRITLE